MGLLSGWCKTWRAQNRPTGWQKYLCGTTRRPERPAPDAMVQDQAACGSLFGIDAPLIQMNNDYAVMLKMLRRDREYVVLTAVHGTGKQEWVPLKTILSFGDNKRILRGWLKAHQGVKFPSFRHRNDCKGAPYTPKMWKLKYYSAKSSDSSDSSNSSPRASSSDSASDEKTRYDTREKEKKRDKETHERKRDKETHERKRDKETHEKKRDKSEPARENRGEKEKHVDKGEKEKRENKGEKETRDDKGEKETRDDKGETEKRENKPREDNQRSSARTVKNDERKHEENKERRRSSEQRATRRASPTAESRQPVDRKSCELVVRWPDMTYHGKEALIDRLSWMKNDQAVRVRFGDKVEWARLSYLLKNESNRAALERVHYKEEVAKLNSGPDCQKAQRHLGHPV